MRTLPTPPWPSKRARGFTLVEMIVSITVLGILAVVCVPLLRMPMEAYLDSARRADLGGELDVVATKLRDDLAQALPGSVRVLQTGARYRLEYLEVRAVGRLRVGNVAGPQSCPATCAAVGANDRLEPLCNDTCFTTLGPLVPPGAVSLTGVLPVPGVVPVPGVDYVVIDPLAGNPYTGGAATPANSVKGRLQGVTAIANGSRITITAHSYPAFSPAFDKQVYVVSTPVTYDCDPATGRLTRWWAYPMAQVQPIAFGGAASSAVLATTVQACNFVAPVIGSAGRVASVWVRLGRAAAGLGAAEAVEFNYAFGVRAMP